MRLSSNWPAVNDIYRDKYVVFMDILGFKNLVSAADQQPAHRNTLLSILTLLKHTAAANPHCGLHLSQFSDCIILSADHSPQGLRDLLMSVDNIVSNLLQRNILLRGGMEVGGVHHDDDFVYGMGVNKAHELQCTKPHDPCILVSGEVCNDMKASGFGHYIEFDQTKDPPRAFLHYLLQYATYDPLTPMPGMEVLDQPAARIIRLMSHRLRVDSGDVLEKAQWFQAYWNRTVAASGVFGRIEASHENPP